MSRFFPIRSRNAFARWVLLMLTALLVLRFFSGHDLTLLQGEPLKGPAADHSFWALLLTGLPQFIISHDWACRLTDALPIALSLLAFLFPGERRIFIALLVVLLVGHVTVETYSVTHSKNSVFLFLVLLPLCFREQHFGLMAEGSRYFILFIFVASAWNKLQHGALTDTDHFARVLSVQHIDLAFQHPGHPTQLIRSWLLQYPFAAFLIFSAGVLLQAFFLVGFLTKSFDRVLLLLLVLFVVLTFVLMRIAIWEMLAGGLFFLLAYEDVNSPAG